MTYHWGINQTCITTTEQSWNDFFVLQLLQIKQETSSLMVPTRWTALRTSMWQAPSSSTGDPPMCMRRGLSTSWRKGPSISPSMFWYCSCGPSSRRQGPLGNLTWLADPAFNLMWARGVMAHTEKAITMWWYIGLGAMVPKVSLVLAYEMAPKGHEYVTCIGNNCCSICIVSSEWTAALLLMVGYNIRKEKYMRNVNSCTFTFNIFTHLWKLCFPILIHVLSPCLLSPHFQGVEPEWS